jgi:RecB family exonuclease
LPVSGRSDRSPWRPATQLLRLALSLLWDPLDPYRLLEFLTHPLCPVGQPIRGRLAKVVAQAPGIHGADWERTVERARAEAVVSAGGDPGAGEAVQAQVDTWIAVSRFGHMPGAPTRVLAEHCRRVAGWAAERGRAPGLGDAQRQSFLAAQQQAVGAAQALEALATSGASTLPRLQLDRLIDQVTAVGTARPGAEEECGHVHLLGQAGAAIDAVPRIWWWDFCAPVLPRRWPWTPSELAQLRGRRADLPGVGTALRLSARAWLRPFLAAKEQLMLVMPRRRAGEPFVPHPLWDRIVALASQTPPPSVDVDRALESGDLPHWLSLRWSRVTHRPLPSLRRWWRLADGRQLTGRSVESFSSLESFVNAPHRWVLRYKARLEPGSLAAIPEGNRQRGALLHRLVEWLFSSGELDWRTADPEALRRWVDDRLPVLLQQEGANYLLPGKRREVEELRATAVAAAWALLGHLRGAGVGAVRVEAPVAGRFRGGRLAGRIDLMVSGKSAGEAVVDLKWGGFNHRCAELSENRHLQLAAYAAMRGQLTGCWPDQAYFVLEEGRMAAQDGRYFPRADRCAPAGDRAGALDLWAAFEQTWAWRREQLDRGCIELNVEGTTPDEASKPPQGALPVTRANDRFDDYIRLLGWPEEA